jgi:dTDP-4-amino-4,6-dideoxygalactose transaminase
MTRPEVVGSRAVSEPRETALSGYVEQWERRFAEDTASPAAVSFTFARTALAAVLRSAGLEPGDAVILSPLTCKVVPLAILAAGLEPVYADIDPDTLNLDPAAIRSATAARIRAVLFQRTYGGSGGVREALDAARSRGLMFVEDCAQCMPMPGNWIGDAAIFSINPGKPLSAGSGGMVVMRDPALAATVKAKRDRLPQTGVPGAVRSHVEALVRNRLLRPRWYWTAFELNRLIDASYRPRPREVEIADEFDAVAGRLNDSQARGGIGMLGRAGHIAAHRVACCEDYARVLREAEVTPRGVDVTRPLYYYPVVVERKEALLERAKRDRAEIVAWPMGTPIYPVADATTLGTYGYSLGSCPHAERTAARLVGLPTHQLVEAPDREHIAGTVLRHVSGRSA